ncbi:hypothetical protein RhiirA4_451046 [Rhizophagus irregularis]|uniref:DUF659 domain-containing protein n=1 Tax=Rhizophagus irregularis TaxID=588596 RepID=A0A2I1FUN3_9GLOM|nr:hypothetical protein RhiirA4_451046 [Rhizophagus irregularis]
MTSQIIIMVFQNNLDSISSLNKEQKESIDIAIIKVFVYCDLLCVKCYRLLDNENNLTLALDRWTSPAGKSLWNFIIHLNNGKNLFWKISDFSNESHTAEFLAQKIQVILDDISVQKFASVVTDAISNVHATQNLITEKFLYILNVRCIA